MGRNLNNTVGGRAKPLVPAAKSRKYGNEHQKLRKKWAEEVARGYVRCARCGKFIQPGTVWHLDHNESGTGYLGPSHAACNLRAASLKALAIQQRTYETQSQVRRNSSRQW